MQITSEKMLFQSENYQHMEQVASQCCGGFLRQLVQETTGARKWNYKRCLHRLLLQVTSYKLITFRVRALLIAHGFRALAKDSIPF